MGVDVAAVHVLDTGRDIPESELPLATQRFFRASNAQGHGSGLGLGLDLRLAIVHPSHAAIRGAVAGPGVR